MNPWEPSVAAPQALGLKAYALAFCMDLEAHIQVLALIQQTLDQQPSSHPIFATFVRDVFEFLLGCTEHIFASRFTSIVCHFLLLSDI